MSESTLTDRQNREREFYETYSRRNPVGEVDFEPVLGKETRPWNCYWFTYGLAREEFHSDGQRLLEFGCGPGVAAVRLAKIGYRVSGFDIAPNNVTQATELAARYGFGDRSDFSAQPAERLAFPDNTFDVVIGFDILHHIEIEASMIECRRVLKPGGVAIFREHVEAPIFDRLRNTWLGRKLFPKEPTFDPDGHITQDERKLNQRDLDQIRAIFPQSTFHRFLVFARLAKLFRSGRVQVWLEKLDYALVRTLPFLGRFGGSVVMVLRKPSA